MGAGRCGTVGGTPSPPQPARFLSRLPVRRCEARPGAVRLVRDGLADRPLTTLADLCVVLAVPGVPRVYSKVCFTSGAEREACVRVAVSPPRRDPGFPGPVAALAPASWSLAQTEAFRRAPGRLGWACPEFGYIKGVFLPQTSMRFLL